MVVTAAFRLLYVSVILGHARRKILQLIQIQKLPVGFSAQRIFAMAQNLIEPSGSALTLIAEKDDGVGRHVRQIELCERHYDIVIERT